MNTLPLFLIALIPSANAADPEALLRAAVQNYDKDHLAALRYSYTETDNDSSGKSVSRITVIEGTPYERVITKNGQPLTGEAEKREDKRYRTALSDRVNETDAQREKRIRRYKSDVKVFQEAPDAFIATLLPDDSVAGRATYVIELKPDPEYKPDNMKTRVLTKIEAKLWIDKQDLRIARAIATVTDTVALGWIMARVGKGGHLEMTQTRLTDGTWLPQEFVVSGEARIFLVDSKKLNQTVTFDGFKRLALEETADLSRN